jgi:hypothetical protein
VRACWPWCWCRVHNCTSTYIHVVMIVQRCIPTTFSFSHLHVAQCGTHSGPVSLCPSGVTGMHDWCTGKDLQQCNEMQPVQSLYTYIKHHCIATTKSRNIYFPLHDVGLRHSLEFGPGMRQSWQTFVACSGCGPTAQSYMSSLICALPKDCCKISFHTCILNSEVRSPRAACS